MTADARTNINIKKQQFRKYRKTRLILDYEKYKVARNSVKWELKRAGSKKLRKEIIARGEKESKDVL